MNGRSFVGGLDTVRAEQTRLSEAHHRIANNLALIAGFVRLQASGLSRANQPLTPQEGRTILEEIGARIETVGSLHRLLSAHPAGIAVELGDYLAQTCSVLAASLADERCVEVVCDAAPLEADPELAGLIGLVTTELVTNAVKYAHPAGAPGRIVVRCHPDLCGALRLSIADDGVGLPEGFNPMTGGGLGLRVVRSLAQQLHASLAFDCDGLGLTVSLVIPGDAMGGASIPPRLAAAPVA